MKVAIVSDIHANLAAFQSVIVDALAQGVEEFWCLGDLVGYGPEPNECIEVLRGQKHLCIPGNHDYAAIGRISTEEFNADAAAAIDWTIAQLTNENREYLGSLPLTIERNNFTLAHGSARDPIWEYVVFADVAQASLAYFNTPTCFVGHTHLPVLYVCQSNVGPCTSVAPSYDAPLPLSKGFSGRLRAGSQERQVVNPGSIGQPRDGNPDARYIVLDLNQRSILYRAIPYPIEETQRKMQEVNLPPRLWMRLSYGM